jgi:hypothetical protein
VDVPCQRGRFRRSARSGRGGGGPGTLRASCEFSGARGIAHSPGPETRVPPALRYTGSAPTLAELVDPEPETSQRVLPVRRQPVRPRHGRIAIRNAGETAGACTLNYHGRFLNGTPAAAVRAVRPRSRPEPSSRSCSPWPSRASRGYLEAGNVRLPGAAGVATDRRQQRDPDRHLCRRERASSDGELQALGDRRDPARRVRRRGRVRRRRVLRAQPSRRGPHPSRRARGPTRSARTRWSSR